MGDASSLRRGKHIFGQTVYVNALERRLPLEHSAKSRRALPESVEVRLCPLGNHRSKLQYQRARSIPEICNITLTPTGQSVPSEYHDKNLSEVYISHSFDGNMVESHFPGWKSDYISHNIGHHHNEMCLANSMESCRHHLQPERPKSAPPGPMTFDFETMDYIEPLPRRSTSPGVVTNGFDVVGNGFDEIDNKLAFVPVTREEMATQESAPGYQPGFDSGRDNQIPIEYQGEVITDGKTRYYASYEEERNGIYHGEKDRIRIQDDHKFHHAPTNNTSTYDTKLVEHDNLNHHIDNTAFLEETEVNFASSSNFDLYAKNKRASNNNKAFWDTNGPALTMNGPALTMNVNSLTKNKQIPTAEEPALTMDEPTMTKEKQASVENELFLTMKEPALTMREPVSTVKEPALTMKDPALTMKDPALTMRDPAFTMRDPAFTMREPALTMKDPALTTREQALTMREPALTMREPAFIMKEPALTTNESTLTMSEPSSTMKDPPSITNEPKTTVQKEVLITLEPFSADKESPLTINKPNMEESWLVSTTNDQRKPVKEGSSQRKADSDRFTVRQELTFGDHSKQHRTHEQPLATNNQKKVDRITKMSVTKKTRVSTTMHTSLHHPIPTDSTLGKQPDSSVSKHDTFTPVVDPSKNGDEEDLGSQSVQQSAKETIVESIPNVNSAMPVNQACDNPVHQNDEQDSATENGEVLQREISEELLTAQEVEEQESMDPNAIDELFASMIEKRPKEIADEVINAEKMESYETMSSSFLDDLFDGLDEPLPESNAAASKPNSVEEVMRDSERDSVDAMQRPRKHVTNTFCKTFLHTLHIPTPMKAVTVYLPMDESSPEETPSPEFRPTGVSSTDHNSLKQPDGLHEFPHFAPKYPQVDTKPLKSHEVHRPDASVQSGRMPSGGLVGAPEPSPLTMASPATARFVKLTTPAVFHGAGSDVHTVLPNVGLKDFSKDNKPRSTAHEPTLTKNEIDLKSTSTMNEPTLNTEQSTSTMKEPVLTMNEPALTTGEPTFIMNKKALATRKPVSTAKEPDLTKNKPNVTMAEPTLTKTEPDLAMTEPALTMTEPALTVDKPASSMTEPTLTMAEQASIMTEPALTITEPALTMNEPALTMNEPALNMNKPALTMNDRALTMNEPALTMKEPALTMNEPALTMNEPALTKNEPVPLREEPALTRKAPGLWSNLNEPLQKSTDQVDSLTPKTTLLNLKPNKNPSPPKVAQKPQKVNGFYKKFNDVPSKTNHLGKSNDTAEKSQLDATEKEVVDVESSSIKSRVEKYGTKVFPNQIPSQNKYLETMPSGKRPEAPLQNIGQNRFMEESLAYKVPLHVGGTPANYGDDSKPLKGGSGLKHQSLTIYDPLRERPWLNHENLHYAELVPKLPPKQANNRNRVINNPPLLVPSTQATIEAEPDETTTYHDPHVPSYKPTNKENSTASMESDSPPSRVTYENAETPNLNKVGSSDTLDNETNSKQRPEPEVFVPKQKSPTISVTSVSQPSEVQMKVNNLSQFGRHRALSLNSDASYKRHLTSAWIEQQRRNIAERKQRNLRRTKSAEFSELGGELYSDDDDTEPSFKLKQSKSEVTLQELDSMYDAFNEIPGKHRPKVSQATEPSVITRARTMGQKMNKTPTNRQRNIGKARIEGGVNIQNDVSKTVAVKNQRNAMKAGPNEVYRAPSSNKSNIELPADLQSVLASVENPRSQVTQPLIETQSKTKSNLVEAKNNEDGMNNKRIVIGGPNKDIVNTSSSDRAVVKYVNPLRKEHGSRDRKNETINNPFMENEVVMPTTDAPLESTAILENADPTIASSFRKFESHKARYIENHQPSNVRYIDGLDLHRPNESFDSTTFKDRSTNVGSPPAKHRPGKVGGFLNSLGFSKLRKAKSEPNLENQVMFPELYEDENLPTQESVDGKHDSRQIPVDSQKRNGNFENTETGTDSKRSKNPLSSKVSAMYPKFKKLKHKITKRDQTEKNQVHPERTQKGDMNPDSHIMTSNGTITSPYTKDNQHPQTSKTNQVEPASVTVKATRTPELNRRVVELDRSGIEREAQMVVTEEPRISHVSESQNAPKIGDVGQTSDNGKMGSKIDEKVSEQMNASTTDEQPGGDDEPAIEPNQQRSHAAKTKDRKSIADKMDVLKVKIFNHGNKNVNEPAKNGRSEEEKPSERHKVKGLFSKVHNMAMKKESRGKKETKEHNLTEATTTSMGIVDELRSTPDENATTDEADMQKTTSSQINAPKVTHVTDSTTSGMQQRSKEQQPLINTRNTVTQRVSYEYVNMTEPSVVTATTQPVATRYNDVPQNMVNNMTDKSTTDSVIKIVDHHDTQPTMDEMNEDYYQVPQSLLAKTPPISNSGDHPTDYYGTQATMVNIKTTSKVMGDNQNRLQPENAETHRGDGTTVVRTIDHHSTQATMLDSMEGSKVKHIIDKDGEFNKQQALLVNRPITMNGGGNIQRTIEDHETQATMVDITTDGKVKSNVVDGDRTGVQPVNIPTTRSSYGALDNHGTMSQLVDVATVNSGDGTKVRSTTEHSEVRTTTTSDQKVTMSSNSKKRNGLKYVERVTVTRSSGTSRVRREVRGDKSVSSQIKLEADLLDTERKFGAWKREINGGLTALKHDPHQEDDVRSQTTNDSEDYELMKLIENQIELESADGSVEPEGLGSNYRLPDTERRKTVDVDRRNQNDLDRVKLNVNENFVHKQKQEIVLQEADAIPSSGKTKHVESRKGVKPMSVDLTKQKVDSVNEHFVHKQKQEIVLQEADAARSSNGTKQKSQKEKETPIAVYENVDIQRRELNGSEFSANKLSLNKGTFDINDNKQKQKIETKDMLKKSNGILSKKSDYEMSSFSQISRNGISNEHFPSNEQIQRSPKAVNMNQINIVHSAVRKKEKTVELVKNDTTGRIFYDIKQSDGKSHEGKVVLQPEQSSMSFAEQINTSFQQEMAKNETKKQKSKKMKKQTSQSSEDLSERLRRLLSDDSEFDDASQYRDDTSDRQYGYHDDSRVMMTTSRAKLSRQKKEYASLPADRWGSRNPDRPSKTSKNTRRPKSHHERSNGSSDEEFYYYNGKDMHKIHSKTM